MPDSVLICYTTTNSLEEAKAIGLGAVENHLAACANVTSPVHSIYRWKGKLESSPEWEVFFKTTEDKILALEKWILSRHSYECPCIVWWKANGATANYAQWVNEATNVADIKS